MPQKLVSRNKIFKDLDLDFDIHPNTKQLNIVSGDVAVARALRNLIMTNNYERPFHPEIGCNIRQSLFDNILISTAVTIKNAIEEVVQNFEPRVSLNFVDVIASPDQNGYDVTISFFIINDPLAKKFNFFLERIR